MGCSNRWTNASPRSAKKYCKRCCFWNGTRCCWWTQKNNSCFTQRGIGCIKDCSSPPPLHLCCAFCSLSTKIWFKLSVNKCAACQHKWQREWAGGQSPPLTIKREKQSKEAIDINKVLTTIDYLALRWWAMIVMDLNSYTQLINIFSFLLKQPIRPGFFLLESDRRSEAVLCLLWHFSRMQWKLLLSSASCSLITHCKADRYFHQLHLSLGKVSKFSSSAHAARTKEIYRGKGQEPFAEPSVSGEIVASWAARGVLRVTGRKDKWHRCGKSLSTTLQGRRGYENTVMLQCPFSIQMRAYGCSVWLQIKATANLSITA